MMRTLFEKTGGWPGMLTLLAALLLLAGIAKAEPTITWLGSNFPWDCSADGSVVVGNMSGGYETFRWTADTGVVPLGMCSGCVLGTGAGTPDVSDDGNHVSATVLGADSTYVTLGLWSKGTGWQEAIPPVPVDGGLLDSSYGSCWGLSGNGDVLVGFYWRPGEAATGLAHAATWSPTSGFEELAPVIKNSRANAASYDGSVVVGWSERFDGVWQPTVWENDGYTVLSPSENWSQAEGVSNDGDIIVGSAYDALTNQVSATAWLRTPEGWQEQTLGVLPGTFPGRGAASAYSVSSAGDVIVGFNDFGNQTGAGFVWTLQEGIVSGSDYITGLGLTLPANFVVDNVTAVSNDGRVIVGFGHDTTVFPEVYEGFVVRRDPVSAVPGAADAGGLAIASNHPNPFNPSTTIALTLAQDQDVLLEVFDVRGRRVRVLHDGPLTAGRQEIVWDGKDDAGNAVASGMYLAQARGAHGEARPHRMMLVK